MMAQWRCVLLSCFGVALVGVSVAFAADPNVLWVEDGSNLTVGDKPTDKQWGGKGVRLTKAEGGGFVFQAKTGYAVGKYVDLDPAYPYLVWRITDVTPHVEGYRGWTGPMLWAKPRRPQYVGQVAHIQTGIFMIDLRQTLGSTYEKQTLYLRMDLHGAALTFSYLKMVKGPEDLIEITSPAFAAKRRLDIGDDVTFRVKLAAPAEDVQFRLFNSYTMPPIRLNGKHVLQGKPEDEPGKIWSTTVKVEAAGGGRAKKGVGYEPGRFLVKAVVLGGQIKEPLWTANPVPFNIVKENAK